MKAPRLHPGDTIGIVATSFPFSTDPTKDYYHGYEKGKAELLKMGFKIKEGRNIRKVRWWTTGTPEEKADDINSMFADPEIKAIIVMDGGQSAITVLEHIDYELIKKHPKPFIGFSDITNFHLAFYTKTNLIGFHMGLLTYSLGWVWHYVVKDEKKLNRGREFFKTVLTSNKKLGKIEPITKWKYYKTGKAEGKLFGGNLSMMTTLVGTKYFPSLEKLKGNILFWETDNISSYRIERGLYILRHAGILDVISGMIIGKLPDIKRTSWEGFTEPTIKELVLESLKGYHFPILAEVDFGHKTVNTPMPIGINAKMDAEKLHLEFLESAVN